MAPSAEVEQVRESLEIALRLWVEPVVTDAGFELSSFVISEDEQMVGVVYEADPLDFLRRYRQTRLEGASGDQCAGGCIDLWLIFYRDAGRIELDLEGFEVLELLRASGHEVLAQSVTRMSGGMDADVRRIANALALVLGTQGPPQSA